VEKMMLVEVILGRETGDKALATALDYVRTIKKTPIVVNDSRGFFANRCVLAYILEGHLMFVEGVPPAMIENAGKQAGMPVGPLSLNDEVGVDLGLKILKATKTQLGDTAIVPEQEALLTQLVETEGRFGRKNKKGFYDYPEGGSKRLWPGLDALQTKHIEAELLDMGELKQRLLVTQALEAARTVEEGVITDPREADVGSILGFGFAPYTGGALSYIDFMGAKTFVELCRKLQGKYGDRFAPPKIVLDMASSGETFYSQAERKKKAA
ncbi:MAG: 3-hydroxyacyl-CoA dehydrogenase, partial [Microvirga sp.]|nr:3-hydroxyacyl-CoA dehydrogenase [Microvirga sp.]